MKVAIFNTITAVAGISAMVNHVMTAGNDASLGTLALIWGGMGVVSIVGTMILVCADTAKQNRREKEHAECLAKAYAMKKGK